MELFGVYPSDKCPLCGRGRLIEVKKGVNSSSVFYSCDNCDFSVEVLRNG